MREKDERFTVEGFVDSIQTGDILSGCGYTLYWGLHLIGSILGLILICALIVWSLISDALFGDP